MRALPRAGTTDRKALLKRALIAVWILAAGIALFSFTLFHMIPIDIVEGWVDAAFKERAGIYLQKKDFKRVFPLGLRADDIEVRNDPKGPALLVLDGAWAGIDPLSLLLGTVKSDFKASINGGVIEGDISFGIRKSVLRAEGRSINPALMPVFERTGLVIDAPFEASASMLFLKGKCPEGALSMKGKDMPEGKVRIKGLPLPFGAINDAGMKAGLKDCAVDIEAAWLEGADVSVRAEGKIHIREPIDASPLELKLEMVPRGAMLDKEFLLSLLQKYRKSANYYLVNVRGTLGSPSVD